MEENNPEVKLKKKGFNKVIAIVIAAAVLLVGGSVAAFILIEDSPKIQYFLYEKNTIDMFAEQVENRYEPELEWAEKSLDNPTENIYELSAEVNMPIPGGTGPVTADQIINNSTITVTTNMDRQEKVASANIEGSFGTFEVGNFNAYLTSEKMMLGLPFLNEILQLKGDDFGKLLQQVDPYTFTGEEKIDFNMLFEGNILPEKDLDYLEDEYVKSIYNALPDDAFKSEDETVKIGNENVNTEKITFHLTEEQLKVIIADTLKKMEKDDRFKEILLNYVQSHDTGPLVFGEDSELNIQDEFEANYDTAIKDAIDDINDFKIPDGLTSTIWVEDDIIVKRDFSIEMGPSDDQLVTFYVKGLINYSNVEQTFEYDFGIIDQGDDQSIAVDGTLSNDDGKTKDSITLSIGSTKLVYESDETLKDSKRDFERVVSFTDETGYTVDVIWSGNATYDGDQMQSEHELTVASDDIMQDLVILYLDKESKVTDGVELPSDDNIKDIGSMNVDEIMTYFETEVTPQFEEWLMGIVGFGL
ncbi:DUF6583 family protein [Ornithinibacillus xuwenensis]|uniref:DUF6583 family protein n=1 Tax=Ornithinibacillus xuwenensis TaxID=3144668 RepID=A0ABU9XBH6_9BACI